MELRGEGALEEECRVLLDRAGEIRQAPGEQKPPLLEIWELVLDGVGPPAAFCSLLLLASLCREKCRQSANLSKQKDRLSLRR